MDSALIDASKGYGFAGFLLILIILGAWRVCRWLAPRLDTWGNRLITAHVDFIESAKKIGQENATTLAGMAVTQNIQAECLERIDETLEAVRRQQAEMHRQNGLAVEHSLAAERRREEQA